MLPSLAFDLAARLRPVDRAGAGVALVFFKVLFL
jgi:hypothetical protein